MDQSGGPTANDVQEQPLEPRSTPRQIPAAKTKPTWREARRKRRKARRRNEEILGWVLVPVIIVGLWWGISATFGFFGTSPGQVWDQLQQVKQALEKKTQAK